MSVADGLRRIDSRSTGITFAEALVPAVAPLEPRAAPYATALAARTP